MRFDIISPYSCKMVCALVKFIACVENSFQFILIDRTSHSSFLTIWNTNEGTFLLIAVLRNWWFSFETVINI